MANDLLTRLKRSSISHLALAITFITSGLIINVIQCILYVCVRPFNKYVFRKLFYYAAYWLYSQVVFTAEWWGQLDVVCYAAEGDHDKYFGKEHALCIMNHRYEIDWLVGFVFCDRIKILGNCKTYAKKSIQYVPLLGWAWKFGESVFLDRSWEKDKEIIGRQVTELVQYPSSMWLLLTAEGTRFTQAKHEASQKFAQEKGLPLLKHHLTPRTKGFTHTVPYLRGKIDALYDVQLAFRQGPGLAEPTIMNLLMGKKVEAHFYIRRVPISTLPEGEAALSSWMHQLYQRKDKMADSFLNTGDFFKESGVPPLPTYRLARRCYSLINIVTWAFIVLVPIIYYLIRLLTSGSTLYISIGAAIIAIFGVFMSKMIGLTKIGKGSSYGTTGPRRKTE